MFRHDTNVGEDRHEVCVASPAWHNVLVNVIDDPCTRRAAEVPTDVEAVWGRRARERVDCACGQRVDLAGFLGAQIAELPAMAIRGNQEMAGA